MRESHEHQKRQDRMHRVGKGILLRMHRVICGEANSIVLLITMCKYF